MRPPIYIFEYPLNRTPRRFLAAQQKKEQESATAQFDQRASALEGQQAMLVTLRTRLERMRGPVEATTRTLGAIVGAFHRHGLSFDLSMGAGPGLRLLSSPSWPDGDGDLQSAAS